MSNRTFYAKIFLFGEYSVIQNSMGLSIPYKLFEGDLKFAGRQKSIDQELKSLGHYLKSLEDKSELDFDFDISSFLFDVGQGLYFDSTIPQGYGVGSSGALCAAVFERYSKDRDCRDIAKLKNIFSKIEGYFHGASSGIDPLNIFLNKPLLIRSRDVIEEAILPDYSKGKGAMFLLNTGRARKTEPLVNLFLEKLNSKDFKKSVEERLIPITNKCINTFLEGNIGELFHSFEGLSDYQYHHFRPMIPTLYQDLWLKGLKTNEFKLKLCGAGGGGFLLGIAPDLKSALKVLDSYEVRPFLFFD